MRTGGFLRSAPAAMFSHGPSDFHNDHLILYNACLASQRLGFIDSFCYHPSSCRPVHVPFHPQVYVDVAVIDFVLPRVEFHRYLQRIVEAGFASA